MFYTYFIGFVRSYLSMSSYKSCRKVDNERSGVRKIHEFLQPWLGGVVCKVSFVSNPTYVMLGWGWVELLLSWVVVVLGLSQLFLPLSYWIPSLFHVVFQNTCLGWFSFNDSLMRNCGSVGRYYHLCYSYWFLWYMDVKRWVGLYNMQ